MKLLTINVESMCFTEQLGTDFELRATPELEQAILTINKACFDEVQKRKEYLLNEYLSKKWQSIKMLESTGDINAVRQTLKEIYEKGKNDEKIRL